MTGDDPQQGFDLAVAALCLKHTAPGDLNLVSIAEVEKLMGGDAARKHPAPEFTEMIHADDTRLEVFKI